jgi:hypothetical protein
VASLRSTRPTHRLNDCRTRSRSERGSSVRNMRPGRAIWRG